MPANRGVGVAALEKACRDYFAATGRRITFEYAMIDGVNDSPEQAAALAALAKRVRAHVNLIPLNEVEDSSFHPVASAKLEEWRSRLEQAGISATIRNSRASDIAGACGQLATKKA